MWECRMQNDECRLKTGGAAACRARRRRSAFCILHSSFCIRRAGFTLLELVLVMVVLTVALAMVAPSLSGFGAGREAEFAGAQLMTLSRWAREQAMSEGRVYRLHYDAANGSYWVTAQVGGVFENLTEEFGQVFALPEGVGMEWDAPQENGAHYIDFHPSGRAPPAQVRITSRHGRVTFIGSRSATELMRVLTPEEVQAG